MIRRILDPGLARRQSYRAGIEDEMRRLDPTGDRQRYEYITPNRLRMGESKMKISKRQLKRIIREEYSLLKRQGLISEMAGKSKGRHMPNGTILDLASQPGGVNIEELVGMFGTEIFDKIDELEADGLLKMMDDGMVISLRGY